MGMTITEKILARHTDLDAVSPGMLINARVDIALGNDITAPIAIEAFRKAGGKGVSIVKRWFWCRIILHPTKTSPPPSNANS